MSFYLFFLCGVLGGALGGMGMGGGTLLIPLLRLLGVEQGIAQGINLLAFLPTSAVALSVHAKNGLLQKEGLFLFILPAVILSAASSVLAVALPARVLSRLFGGFLIGLSFYQFRVALKKD
ncbi:MAG: sulfite exporter TauE/SafE family protein [Clostridia bacterium]|nr:sulfite exporter TauE/SafE family protein [Clostridia bacterium]